MGFETEYEFKIEHKVGKKN